MMTHYGEGESRVGRRVREMVNGRWGAAVAHSRTNQVTILIVLQVVSANVQGIQGAHERGGTAGEDLLHGCRSL
jgi:hypothetical protein